jgi:hypothetical protein
MSPNRPFLEANPYIGVTVTACVVFSVAVGMFGALVRKGWKTKTMREYTIMYLLFANMALVWGS